MIPDLSVEEYKAYQTLQKIDVCSFAALSIGSFRRQVAQSGLAERQGLDSLQYEWSEKTSSDLAKEKSYPDPYHPLQKSREISPEQISSVMNREASLLAASKPAGSIKFGKDFQERLLQYYFVRIKNHNRLKFLEKKLEISSFQPVRFIEKRILSKYMTQTCLKLEFDNFIDETKNYTLEENKITLLKESCEVPLAVSSDFFFFDLIKRNL